MENKYFDLKLFKIKTRYSQQIGSVPFRTFGEEDLILSARSVCDAKNTTEQVYEYLSSGRLEEISRVEELTNYNGTRKSLINASLCSCIIPRIPIMNLEEEIEEEVQKRERRAEEIDYNSIRGHLGY